MKAISKNDANLSRSVFLPIATSIALLLLATQVALASTDNSETSLTKTLTEAKELLLDKSYQNQEFCQLFNRSRAAAIVPSLEEGGLIWTISKGHGILLWRDVPEGSTPDTRSLKWHVKKLFSYGASGLGPTLVGFPILSWFGVATEKREIILLATSCDPTARDHEAHRCKGKKSLSPTAGLTVATFDFTANPGELVGADEIFALSNGNGLRLTVVQIPIGPNYTKLFSFDTAGLATDIAEPEIYLEHMEELNKIANEICRK